MQVYEEQPMSNWKPFSSARGAPSVIRGKDVKTGKRCTGQRMLEFRGKTNPAFAV